jgi:hypothetical protein
MERGGKMQLLSVLEQVVRMFTSRFQQVNIVPGQQTIHSIFILVSFTV